MQIQRGNKPKGLTVKFITDEKLTKQPHFVRNLENSKNWSEKIRLNKNNQDVKSHTAKLVIDELTEEQNLYES